MKSPHSLIASSSLSSTHQNNYDVFLSFRGDTRNTFTSHLYEALRQKGINTFLDDDGLERGRAISKELRKAIEGSRCSVVILSGDYASSGWCLDELVKILQCMEDSKQIVLPIFYHVDPSHVRKQIGTIGEAFQRFEQQCSRDVEKVESWRTALTQVGGLAGFHLKDGNEAKFVEDFIKEVSSKLGVALSKNLKDFVGMDSRLKELKLCVSSSPHVRFVGICGMGGLGKTTLARAYFDSMSSQFEASSFLANVREVYGKDQTKGLVKLQKQLLTDILKGEHRIDNVYQGQGLIRTRLCCKRVLVVLDDVDHLNQLKGLAEKNNWFAYGSRIILTTRDEGLLKSMYKQEGYIIHKLEKLKDSEALQLFSRNAFKSDYPSKDYKELTEKVVEYANGLPLALELLGSFLGRCESIDEWASALERLRKYPEEEIMKKLQISFDALKETEKSIFLDIACFFNGSPKCYIMDIMDSCGFHPEIGIRSLVDKSLLYMEHDNRLRMHDLLEEMGKGIVREESRKEPGRRSRIWLWDDFYDVMSNETGTKEVEAIVCKASMPENVIMRGFSNMKKLRLLIVSSKSDCQDLEHISNELQILQWSGFPLNSFPPRFQPHRLVELNLQSSKIKQLWNNPMKPLYKLKSIDLSFSRNIRKFEDFSLFPNLEKLNLSFCYSLEEIHPSITILKRLTSLSLLGCNSLKSFPTTMDGLESLKVLKLSGCSRLRNLSFLNTIVGNVLEELDLSNCGLRDGAFPDDFGCLVSLKYLYLSYNEFSCLPAGFNRLSKLRSLDLSGCRNLTSLGPALPDGLESVKVNNCRELHTFLDPLSQCNLRCSTILCVDCFKLVNSQGSERTAITSLGRYLQNPPSPSERFDIILPGEEIPSWFTHQVRGSSSIRLPLHSNWCTNNWMGFALSMCPNSNRVHWQIEINEEDWGFGPVWRLPPYGGFYPHLWILYLPRDKYFHSDWHNKSGHFQFSFKYDGLYYSEKDIQCGVRLVYEKDIQELNLTATHELPIGANMYEDKKYWDWDWDGDEDKKDWDEDGDEDEVFEKDWTGLPLYCLYHCIKIGAKMSGWVSLCLCALVPNCLSFAMNCFGK